MPYLSLIAVALLSLGAALLLAEWICRRMDRTGPNPPLAEAEAKQRDANSGS